MRAIDEFNIVQESRQNRPKVPFNVWRLFECEHKYLANQGIDITGNQVSLGGDWMDISEAKESFNWLVEQFGGVVLWDVE